MPRIRSIKPEYWTDEVIVQLPYVARLFFIGLWNFCDDYGYFPDKPEQMRIFIFPCEDKVDASNIIDLLIAVELVERYYDEDSDNTFLKIKNWTHQKVDNPGKSKMAHPNLKKLKIPQEARREVALKYGCEPGGSKEAECYYCGKPGQIYWHRLLGGRPSTWVSFSLELDHLIPEAGDGPNKGYNIVLACRDCNRSKGTKHAFQWLLTPYKYERNPSLGKFREGYRGLDIPTYTTENPRRALDNPIEGDKKTAIDNQGLPRTIEDSRILSMTSVGGEGMGGDGDGRGVDTSIHTFIHSSSDTSKKNDEPVLGSPEKKEPPVGPPLKNEHGNNQLDDSLLRTVEECAELYGNHKHYEHSREVLMHKVFTTSMPGYESYEDWLHKLKEWNAAYAEWLVFTRGDTLKTLRDYLQHFANKLFAKVGEGVLEPSKAFIRPKYNKTKRKEVVMPWTSQAFMDAWAMWKDYLAQQFNGLEYSVPSEQAALHRLSHCSGGQELAAIEVIKAAMAAASRYLNPIHKTNGKSNSKEPTFGGIAKSKLQNLYNMEVKVQRRD